MSSPSIPILHVTIHDDGKVSAEGQIHDTDYFAVAGNIDALRAQVLADARCDAWPAWGLQYPIEGDDHGDVDG